jgi:tetratricopeptide (TPR) repeat protein
VGLQEADRDFEQRKYAEALDKYRAAAERAAAEKNAQVEVEAAAQVARCHSLLGRRREGTPWLVRAADRADRNEPLGWSRFLGVRGIFERESGDKVRAKATFVEMFEFCAANQLPRRAVDAVHHIAIVVPAAEQPDWALKGIREAEKLGDDAWLAVLWNNLGATYEDLRQYDRSLEAYRKARTFHHKTGDESRKLAADWAVAHALRLSGKPGEALEILVPALAWAEKRHAREPGAETLEWVGWCKKDLGECRAALGDKTAGVALLKEARSALVESGLEKWWAAGLTRIEETIRALEKP